MREFKQLLLFPPSVDVWNKVAEVRAQCRVCQACGAANQTPQVVERQQPVIDQFLASVCLDIFDMPEEE